MPVQCPLMAGKREGRVVCLGEARIMVGGGGGDKSSLMPWWINYHNYISRGFFITDVQ